MVIENMDDPKNGEKKKIGDHIPTVEFSLETGRDSLTDIVEERPQNDILEEFTKDLEGLLDSIDSYKEDLKKAKKIF